MNNLKKLAALLLVLCMAIALCACGGDSEPTNDGDTVATTTTAEETTTTTAPVAAAFKVTVVDPTGAPVEGVMLQVCKDSCIPAKTDADGVATFNVEVSDEHKLSVLSCPAGYIYTGEAEVYLEDGMTACTVVIEKEA